ncbi:DUF3301 domain-containing protein [Gallaecimonas kandeliae]|uniref:DUF3301 domain-containing protein n=1 Tax=Gallaecimonas kandeliae TaxID=3029055 RepID=UPI002647F44C|nr:DUF3301 domain-containing protein [Gallaecimonas kandeliae]WKE64536.1 DUF3301 domain-containing protein [Gallaecimonas kandeliae]
MSELLTLLLLALGLFIFWRLRQQEEWARAAAVQLCQRHQVQLLEVALHRRRLGRRGLVHHYVMEVSLNADERYQVHFAMAGRRLLDVQWPVMREY